MLGWCAPVGWVSGGSRERAGGFAAIGVALAVRITWTAAFTMALISTLGFNAGVRVDGLWGTGTVDAKAENSGMV